MKSWHLYLIKRCDDALYCGITTDVERRFAEHCGQGVKAAKALKGRTPLKLTFSASVGNHSQALKLERKVKKLPKAKKQQIIDGQLLLSAL